MIGQINTNPAELERAAKRLDVIAENITQKNRKLTRARVETFAAWQSSLTSNFSRSVDATGISINTCERQVRKVAGALRSIAAAVRRVEQELGRVHTTQMR